MPITPPHWRRQPGMSSNTAKCPLEGKITPRWEPQASGKVARVPWPGSWFWASQQRASVFSGLSSQSPQSCQAFSASFLSIPLWPQMPRNPGFFPGHLLQMLFSFIYPGLNEHAASLSPLDWFELNFLNYSKKISVWIRVFLAASRRKPTQAASNSKENLKKKKIAQR